MEKVDILNNFLITLKEKIKHAGYRLRSRRGIFTKIYKLGGFSGSEYPMSGPGSNLVQTKKVREAIPEILKELKVEIILDAPCGDFTWMREIDLGDISYIGADIVDELIEKNVRNYSGKNRTFIVADVVKDVLPKGDIILCRDCFVHLSNKDIVRALKNFKRSQSYYLLTTTFYDIKENRDLVSGRGWRPINLQKSPFNFPEPVKLINENCTEQNGKYSDKSLGLWRLDQIPLKLNMFW